MNPISDGVKIEITNRQKIKSLNLKQLRRSLAKTTRLLSIFDKKISLVLCDNKFIADLNRRYFKKSQPTDVIAFNLSDSFDPAYLGEIVVSLEEAVRVVKDPGVISLDRWQDELFLYCLHGILHLIGYDDRTKKQRERMERKQEEILEKLGKTSHLGVGNES